MSRRMARIMFALAVVAVFLGAAVAGAEAQVNAMSGKATMKYSTRTVVPVGDVEGHAVSIGEAGGLNVSTGKWDFMNGAAASSVGTQDLTKGNGTQLGYFILSRGDDKTVAKTTGMVKTVLSPEGRPLTTMSGEWKYVACTGTYAGCTGQGVYQGNFISQEEYIVEFKGIMVQ